MTALPSPLIVAKNMAAIAQRQAAIAQCGRQIAHLERSYMFTTAEDAEIAFWREVADHLENTNFD